MGINDEAPRGTSATAGPSSPNLTVRTPAYLGPTVRIKGEVTGEEDLKVDGKIEGPISLPDHRLTVGASAEVIGEILGREIVIYGRVTGNLYAKDRLEIKKDGSAVGEMTTARILIEDGAYVKAKIEIEQSGTPGRTDPDTVAAIAAQEFKLKSIRTARS